MVGGGGSVFIPPMGRIGMWLCLSVKVEPHIANAF